MSFANYSDWEGNAASASGYDDYPNNNNQTAINPEMQQNAPSQSSTLTSETGGADGSKRGDQREPPFSFITNPTINSVLINVNPDLFVSKVFYFFFYSAFGSLFPLMAVYFKQLGMNPIQAGKFLMGSKAYLVNRLIFTMKLSGTLIGIRPFVEGISAPFWSSIADKFQKSKAILLFSLGCWIVFTFSLAFIRPPASACVIFNETHHILYTPYSEASDSEIYDDTAGTMWPNVEPTSVTETSNSSSQNSSLVDATTIIVNTFEDSPEVAGRFLKKRG